MRARWFALWVLAGGLAGCPAPATDHERLADEQLAAGNYTRALAEYQAAQRSGARTRVWAKAAAAAVKAQDFDAAIDALSELAREDPTRVTEAAVGLEAIARLADRGGQGGTAVVAKAVLAVRAIAPGRPLGRLPLPSVSAVVDPTEAIGLIPTAIATAGSPRTVDSLLLRYAQAQRETVACDAAAGSFKSLLRRTNQPRMTAAAREGLAGCALLLGQDALAGGNAPAAERWFEEVVALDGESARGWTANIGLGDARLLKGDALGAAVAYQAVVSGATVPDSLRQAAIVKLNGLGAATTQPPAGDT